MAIKMLRRIAEEVLGPGKAASIWARIDVVGDIAVIKNPLTGGLTLEDLRMVAEELLRRMPYIKSVWLAETPVTGAYKLRRFRHLAGEDRSTTLYKEHGCTFKVDIKRVFVTPRLNYEHIRIARLVKPGEVVVNMFAGAGLFSIIIACKSRPARVYSIDINRDAYELMKHNISLNRLEGIVVPIHGDAARVIEEDLTGVADRVLMPLPDLALDYMGYALKALRGRGMIHVYLHVKANRGEDPVRIGWMEVEGRGLPLRMVYGRIVRRVGPRMYQVVLDLEAMRDG